MANCVYALTLGLLVSVSSILATDFSSVVKKTELLISTCLDKSDYSQYEEEARQWLTYYYNYC